MLNDRRRYDRRSADRPCKMFHRPSRRYVPARTCDLSDGGAMLLIDEARVMAAGDDVDVMVAWTSRPILPADSLVHARVVRVSPGSDGRQRVAVTFEPAGSLAAVA